jgi:hypothetical protein
MGKFWQKGAECPIPATLPIIVRKACGEKLSACAVQMGVDAG